jgi:hypothetical protein
MFCVLLCGHLDSLTERIQFAVYSELSWAPRSKPTRYTAVHVARGEGYLRTFATNSQSIAKSTRCTRDRNGGEGRRVLSYM